MTSWLVKQLFDEGMGSLDKKEEVVSSEVSQRSNLWHVWVTSCFLVWGLPIVTCKNPHYLCKLASQGPKIELVRGLKEIHPHAKPEDNPSRRSRVILSRDTHTHTHTHTHRGENITFLTKVKRLGNKHGG